MPKRAKSDNQPLPKQQPEAVTRANLLSDLYWFVCVVEAGGFSAAADQTGIGKSGLSRRITDLERQLNAQLLNRSARFCTMTTVGEQIYRYALDLMGTLDIVMLTAQESASTPTGLIKLAVPSALSDWTLAAMASFQRTYPHVQFSLVVHDGPIDLGAKSLDLALTINAVSNPGNVVARELAELQMIIVASPSLLQQMGQPKDLANVADSFLIATGSASRAEPWALARETRRIVKPALIVECAQTALKAARAGMGLAYVPLHSCRAELATLQLQRACADERVGVVILRALTLPRKGISSATRHFIEHIRETLKQQATTFADGP
ncbi:MAG: LysR family transcriptional regulator [Pseudomonas sp.]|uniref:LysR family transcriptional regulator n=1 Tax=Pseudomonas sp. TaxID=306 RepID=UPI0030F13867